MGTTGINSVEALLDLHEGTRARLYRCPAGYWTIGRGRNLEAKGLSPDEIEYLFKNDLNEALESLRLEPYWLDLDEVRQAVG